MSGTSSPNSGLTRRSFLKATGAAAGALGFAGAANMIATDTWLAPAQAHAETGAGRIYVPLSSLSMQLPSQMHGS